MCAHARRAAPVAEGCICARLRDGAAVLGRSDRSCARDWRFFRRRRTTSRTCRARTRRRRSRSPRRRWGRCSRR
eukprot:794785-Prymnesium_polylepis.1